jgi:hypothetical protein
MKLNPSGPDQRGENRYPVNKEELKLQLLLEDERTPATILNVSKSGISLEVSRMIPPGHPVKFEVGSQIILAEVSNARWDENGPLVGLRILSVYDNAESESSLETFSPSE